MGYPFDVSVEEELYLSPVSVDATPSIRMKPTCSAKILLHLRGGGLMTGQLLQDVAHVGEVSSPVTPELRQQV